MDILSFSTIAESIKKAISKKCGLNLSQTRILLYFGKNNNTALKMGDLADKLKISLSTLSRQLQQKKTLELVIITRSENDSSKTVVLNEKGIAKIKELKSSLKEIEANLFAGFSDKDISVFNSMFNKLVKKVEKNSLK
ncbi:winged helix-turn-helix transcriptional regulator [Lactobacillus sp. M0403]|uniref:MarR family winged helix-turn-helix transcriptional regulator n=1 Tax=Lactobacillus TaxID=1578 RepID=UPI00164EE0BB|nr:MULTISPECIES: MarR family winged helix-turn-helix transcriptional regulator [Lactobacillus]MBC6360910.1 MarR family transcriptional regulator [Lactobacillus apis]MBH9985406.1 winged helix-turn-helix transcriptional regulator [Lactobacillus sp. M0390]MBI0092914.1 winged helix-turn-helix transcriptional regulator [Lactobacillus sp. M0403]MCO6529411.1 winged helix-turn-helix transcriptional regulator [Lactobacillus sp.]